MSVLKDEQQLAGLWCSDVLTGLTEYLAGSLDAETRQKVESHVKRCHRCERFGGAFATVIQSIRSNISDEPSIDILKRLESRLGS